MDASHSRRFHQYRALSSSFHPLFFSYYWISLASLFSTVSDRINICTQNDTVLSILSSSDQHQLFSFNSFHPLFNSLRMYCAKRS